MGARALSQLRPRVGDGRFLVFIRPDPLRYAGTRPESAIGKKERVPQDPFRIDDAAAYCLLALMSPSASIPSL